MRKGGFSPAGEVDLPEELVDLTRSLLSRGRRQCGILPLSQSRVWAECAFRLCSPFSSPLFTPLATGLPEFCTLLWRLVRHLALGHLRIGVEVERGERPSLAFKRRSLRLCLQSVGWEPNGMLVLLLVFFPIVVLRGGGGCSLRGFWFAAFRTPWRNGEIGPNAIEEVL